VQDAAATRAAQEGQPRRHRHVPAVAAVDGQERDAAPSQRQREEAAAQELGRVAQRRQGGEHRRAGVLVPPALPGQGGAAEQGRHAARRGRRGGGRGAPRGGRAAAAARARRRQRQRARPPRERVLVDTRRRVHAVARRAAARAEPRHDAPPERGVERDGHRARRRAAQPRRRRRAPLRLAHRHERRGVPPRHGHQDGRHVPCVEGAAHQRRRLGAREVAAVLAGRGAPAAPAAARIRHAHRRRRAVLLPHGAVLHALVQQAVQRVRHLGEPNGVLPPRPTSCRQYGYSEQCFVPLAPASTCDCWQHWRERPMCCWREWRRGIWCPSY